LRAALVERRKFRAERRGHVAHPRRGAAGLRVRFVHHAAQRLRGDRGPQRVALSSASVIDDGLKRRPAGRAASPPMAIAFFSAPAMAAHQITKV
jgi:hypothetical protein